MEPKVAALVDRLSSADEQERLDACEALAEMERAAEDADALAALSHRLADEHYVVRQAASRALAKLQRLPFPEQCEVRDIHLKPDDWVGSSTRMEQPKPGGAYRG